MKTLQYVWIALSMILFAQAEGFRVAFCDVNQVVERQLEVQVLRKAHESSNEEAAAKALRLKREVLRTKIMAIVKQLATDRYDLVLDTSDIHKIEGSWDMAFEGESITVEVYELLAHGRAEETASDR